MSPDPRGHSGLEAIPAHECWWVLIRPTAFRPHLRASLAAGANAAGRQPRVCSGVTPLFARAAPPFPARDAGDGGGLPGDTEAGAALPAYRSIPLVSLLSPLPASQRRVCRPGSSNCSLPAGTIRMALDLTMARRTGARRRVLSWYGL
jgi:hypothetical protein